jgi:UDP-N-acetylmuramate dehydrogenase
MRVDPPPALSTLTTLGLGGPPSELFRASTEHELIEALRAYPDAVVVGGGSNLVVADEGLSVPVVQIATRGFSFRRDGDHIACAVESGEPWDDFVAEAVREGAAGVEALSGIPGLVGATPVQNVGAYGQEVADTLESVTVWDRELGAMRTLAARECRFGYRSSLFRGESRYVVVRVTFRFTRSHEARVPSYAELRDALGVVDPDTRVPLVELRDMVIALRRKKGMVTDPQDPDSRSAGSFFTNALLGEDELAQVREKVEARLGAGVSLPTFADASGKTKVSAAWLIERAGFSKGYGEGQVGISRKHTLALVNRGAGTTRELLALADEVRRGVFAAFGVTLEPEPIVLGTRVPWQAQVGTNLE